MSHFHALLKFAPRRDRIGFPLETFQTPGTLGLNEQEVYKNVSGVLLSVYKDFLKFPLNAPTQKIIGWEIFVQSQSKHFIPVQKQVTKRRSNMHEIKK